MNDAKKGPFVGYFSTPLTNSKIVETYLNLLPAYKLNISPFLKGLYVGFFHGYFLVGSFTKLDLLQDALTPTLMGPLSAISLVLLLTVGLGIYGNIMGLYAFEKEFLYSKDSYIETNFSNPIGWQQLLSGFFFGGFAGCGIAWIILSLTYRL